MSQRDVPKGSFQEGILNLLRDNPDREYTLQEIKDYFKRTTGSTSGTLSVLSKNGLIKKSNTYPARYSYNYNTYSPVSEVEPEDKPFKEAIIHKSSPDLRDVVDQLRQEIQQLDERRQKLAIALEVIEKKLSQ